MQLTFYLDMLFNGDGEAFNVRSGSVYLPHLPRISPNSSMTGRPISRDGISIRLGQSGNRVVYWFIGRRSSMVRA